ncbi:MAG: hypothetical protein K2K28_01250, partial [Clostridia bacterium]|nr:hypothetical protein [Clostridia bacterium]
MHDAEIIVADIEAVMQLFPAQIQSIDLAVGGEYEYSTLPQKLVQMGYTREYSVESKGTFAVRGDILDLFPVNCENPLRVDFFGDTVEKIRPYDSVSGERLECVEAVSIIAATDAAYNKADIQTVKTEVAKCLKTCADSAAFRRAKAISEELFVKLESGAPFAGASFVMPLLSSSCTVFGLLNKDTCIIFDECKLINDAMTGLYREHSERVRELIKGGEAFDFSFDQLVSPELLCEGFKNYRCVALQTFTSSTQFFKPLKTYSFNSSPAPSYLNAMPQLVTDLKNWLSNGYR